MPSMPRPPVLHRPRVALTRPARYRRGVLGGGATGLALAGVNAGIAVSDGRGRLLLLPHFLQEDVAFVALGALLGLVVVLARDAIHRARRRARAA